ncbi:hypothetical protein [Arthrobacter sp. UYEF3]|uniref:hypothetical protein n=1 Tax=Arthrobacter sp. UYEF3 TaxID=1756365 RepID=UPI0033959FB5
MLLAFAHAAVDATTAKPLTTALEIDEAKIATALTDIHTAKQAKRAAAQKTRLDKSATDGALTQAEADTATKAVIRGGGGRYHQPQHPHSCELMKTDSPGCRPHGAFH